MRKIKQPVATDPCTQRDPEPWMPTLQLQVVAVDPARWSPRARQQARWFAFELHSRPRRLH